MIKINSLDLERALNELGLIYPKERIASFGEKEQNIFCAIRYTKENAFNILKMLYQDKKYLDTEECKQLFRQVEIWIEYITITTLGLGDVLATILNDIFELNIEKNIYFSTICKNLTKASKQPFLSTQLANKISKIISTNQYKELNAFCNYVKHNNVVETNIKLTLEKPFWKLNIKKFQHKGIPYDSMYITEIFEKSDFIHNEYLTCLETFINYAQSIKQHTTT